LRHLLRNHRGDSVKRSRLFKYQVIIVDSDVRVFILSTVFEGSRCMMAVFVCKVPNS
jgi:hypothetical protein